MLKSLKIKNFRLFKSLNIDSLNRVNLIAGENNSGKTALLEAFYLLFGDIPSIQDFPSAFRSSYPLDSRGRTRTAAHSSLNQDEFENFWIWLLNQKDLRRAMEIELAGDGVTYRVVLNSENANGSREFGFDYFKDGSLISSCRVSKGEGTSWTDRRADSEFPKLVTFSTNPSSPTEDAEYFNRIAAKRGGETKLVELLQVVDPRIQDLKYLKLGSQPLVYADVGMEDLIPMTQLGQGFTRLLRLFSEILTAQSEIVLIDEIENGIHYSAMPKVWKGIATIAQQEDLQIFATTHSYECIRSAHESFASGSSYDLALHRLEWIKDEIRVSSYDRSNLETSFEMNLEVR